jgi:hypothetical protein
MFDAIGDPVAPGERLTPLVAVILKGTVCNSDPPQTTSHNLFLVFPGFIPDPLAAS